jgi:hypothetical protein
LVFPPGDKQVNTHKLSPRRSMTIAGLLLSRSAPSQDQDARAAVTRRNQADLGLSPPQQPKCIVASADPMRRAWFSHPPAPVLMHACQPQHSSPTFCQPVQRLEQAQEFWILTIPLPHCFRLPAGSFHMMRGAAHEQCACLPCRPSGGPLQAAATERVPGRAYNEPVSMGFIGAYCAPPPPPPAAKPLPVAA